MVAVFHQRPCWQHLACCSVNSRHIGSKSRFLPTPPAFDVPVGGGSRQNIAIPFGTDKLEWCGYPMVKKFWRYLYSFWHNARIWHSTHTDTAWRHRPRLHIASRGKNQTVQKWTSVQTVSQQKLHVIRHSNNKWLKVTLLALNVQIKNVLKRDQNRVQRTDLRMQLHYLHVVIVVSDIKVTSSTVVVIAQEFGSIRFNLVRTL